MTEKGEQPENNARVRSVEEQEQQEEMVKRLGCIRELLILIVLILIFPLLFLGLINMDV